MKKILIIFCLSQCILLSQDIDLNILDTAFPIETNGKYGLDTMKCEENLSIYTEFYKHKSYGDAFNAWAHLFLNAPKRTKNIYIHGSNMFKSFIKNTEDSIQRELLIDYLLDVYDQRNIFFPGQEGYVLGMKGGQLYKYRKQDIASVTKAYRILEESFNIDQQIASPTTLNYYFQAGAKLTQQKVLSKESLINLFSDVSSVIDYKEANINQIIFALSQKDNLSSKESKRLKKIEKELITLNDLRANMEKILAPHITCEKLVALYENKFESNGVDVSWLERAAQLLKRKDCVDSNIYFKIAGRLYESDPSPRSAFYMGYLSQKKENYSSAIDYFYQAVEGEDDPIKKSDYLYYLSSSHAALTQYKQAKKYALEAIKFRAGWGKPYVLIGDLYAQSSRACGDNTGNNQNDEFTKRVGYWAAMEKYRYAKYIDKSLEDDVNNKIKLYSSQAPDKTTTFQIIGLDQPTYKISCWYTETVQNPYYTE